MSLLDNSGNCLQDLPEITCSNCGCGNGTCGCSTCDTGCSSCSTSCDTCCPTNPNLIGGTCITIDKSNPNSRTISTECNPTVSSSDSTVGVTVTTTGGVKDYDLTVACSDQLVKTQSCDPTAGYLNDKIKVTSPITKAVTCGDITIGLDTAALALSDKDEKVAVAANCTPGYLQDLITVGAGLTKTVSSCVVDISIDCTTAACTNKWHKPAMKLVVKDTVIITQANNADMYYVLVNDATAGGSAQVLGTDFIQEVAYGCIQENNGRIEVLKPGLYAYGFSGNQEQSEGINGSRVLLLKYDASSNTGRAILESRYSGRSDGVSRPVNAWESNNSDVTANGASGFNIGLGKYLERLPFGNSSICWFDVGDKLGLGCKLSTRIEDPSYSDPDAKFAILGESEAFAAGDSGASFYMHMIGDFCTDTTIIPDC